MAISLGATSEQLLRGVDRVIESLAGAFPKSITRGVKPIPRAWAAERGKDLATARVSVSGGFPGSLRAQQSLARTTLHLTDRWLIIGEGTNGGFALPISRLDGCSVQYCGGLQPPCLVMWYRDDTMTGSFAISFEGTARNRAGHLRANVWQHLLAEANVAVIPTDVAAFIPSIHCPWTNIDHVVTDDVLFSSRAQASTGGRFATTLDTADVWITDEWLLWCADHGAGLNCINIQNIIECRNGFGDRVAIGIEDACGARYDVYFDFGIESDRARPSATVQQILAAHGVPVGVASAANAPWRRGGTMRPSEI